MHSLNSTSGASLSTFMASLHPAISRSKDGSKEPTSERVLPPHRPQCGTRDPTLEQILPSFPLLCGGMAVQSNLSYPIRFHPTLKQYKREALPLRANGATFALIIYASWEICQTQFLLLFSSSSSCSSSFLGFWLTALWQGHGQPGSVARFFRTMIQGERERNGMV